MEKQNVVEPGRTPGNSQTPGTKQAGTKPAQIEVLDDDFTKRASDKVADGLNDANGS